ncbi:MAG: hypothetical protein ACSHX0_11800 [Akkermansiaceae bacterium]
MRQELGHIFHRPRLSDERKSFDSEVMLVDILLLLSRIPTRRYNIGYSTPYNLRIIAATWNFFFNIGELA